jgi:5'-3' exoribonuclease 2
VLEEPGTVVDGVEYPADYAGPNPNGELDNLYLDMNGIVHPCTHPEGRPAPETEDEMMLEVFKYTDRVVGMARPRKVLMMAVDGVAPRAKMNQQRSRRFRAAQDARLLEEAKENAIVDAEARGEVIDDAIKGKRVWDTNVITPGTPFMDTLAISLRYWVAYKLNNDPGWKDLKVIISDASVPGEGEHKIMEFVRSQRSDPSHDPNTSHSIYGLDADLIFLGLATHEPHFRILREDVFAQDKKRKGQNLGVTEAELKRQAEEKEADQTARKPFIWLHVDILRQYLEVELDVPRLSFPTDFERAIDDWVFMCFFVGNDFLPHMPSLDVRDNGIDTLLNIWKRSLPKMKGYMTCDGSVNLERVEIMMQGLGQQEDQIFRRKREGELRRLRNEKRQKLEKEQRNSGRKGGAPPPPSSLPAISKNRGEKAPVNPLDNLPLYTTSGESVGAVHMTNSEIVANRNSLNMANMANKSAAQEMKSQLLKGVLTDSTPAEEDEATDSGAADADTATIGTKRKSTEELVKKPIPEDLDEPEDNIRLWEPGYRDRYYVNKFHISVDDKDFRRQVVEKYIEGVCWVLLYYYQGCPSWKWFYPYHYAPFAQDIVDIGGIQVEFKKEVPFKPFEQLMGVLPAASSHTLPKVFRPLMSEPDSEIIDFYPTDFPIDMNGKKMSWQGIALLPFIDEGRLLGSVQKLYPLLTADESRRNARKQDILLLSRWNELCKKIDKSLYSNGEETYQFMSDRGQGLAGTVYKDEDYDPSAKLIFPLKEGDMPGVDNNMCLTVQYAMPKLDHVHKSMLLSGVSLRDPILTPEEKEMVRNGGRRNNYGNGYYGNSGGYNSYNNDRSNPPPLKRQRRSGGYQYYAENPAQGTRDDYRQGGQGGGQRWGSDQYPAAKGSYRQGGYGGRGGYPQQYSHNPGPRNGYDQTGYGQSAYGQTGYAQGEYRQGGYSQGGHQDGSRGSQGYYRQEYGGGANQQYGVGSGSQIPAPNRSSTYGPGPTDYQGRRNDNRGGYNRGGRGGGYGYSNNR